LYDDGKVIMKGVDYDWTVGSTTKVTLDNTGLVVVDSLTTPTINTGIIQGSVSYLQLRNYTDSASITVESGGAVVCKTDNFIARDTGNISRLQVTPTSTTITGDLNVTEKIYNYEYTSPVNQSLIIYPSAGDAKIIMSRFGECYYEGESHAFTVASSAGIVKMRSDSKLYCSIGIETPNINGIIQETVYACLNFIGSETFQTGQFYLSNSNWTDTVTPVGCGTATGGISVNSTTTGVYRVNYSVNTETQSATTPFDIIVAIDGATQIQTRMSSERTATGSYRKNIAYSGLMTLTSGLKTLKLIIYTPSANAVVLIGGTLCMERMK
jgi:hypothetical protein